MAYSRTFIPYGTHWSTPFAKWQGQLQSLHPLRLAAQTVRSVFEHRSISPEGLDGIVLGWTVPSPQCFYGAPWVAALAGAPEITGPMIHQACATSARGLQTAAGLIESGENERLLLVMADRTSNGPHLTYPNPMGPGGKPDAEDWVWDSFSEDPWAKGAMVQTAENVAREAGIGREEQDAMALLRFEQYQQALAGDRSFQKRYLAPVEINPTGRKVIGKLETDEGVFPTSADGLKKLRPMMPEGSVTFGSQTHPADGNAGCLVTSEAHAKELSSDPNITVRLVSSGEARVKKGFMAMATVPAARQALKRAGFEASECVIKTHNPFAVNDVYFAREMGIAPEAFNEYGSSLVYGHPQAPTGMRLIAELIEQLVLKGGGRGLFVGCAAGDNAMAITLEVS